MLGLPEVTETSKQLPKKAIYEKFNMNTAAKAKFDDDISKIVIVNEISPNTIAIAAGEKVSSFYVLLVSLKRKDFDEKTIAQISKLIPQKMLFILEYNGESRLAIYHTKLIQSEWKRSEEQTVQLDGLNLDDVWENAIKQIGAINVSQGNTLDEQLRRDEHRAKLKKEIDKLEKQARNEKQPKKKFELAQKINKLKKDHQNLK